MQQDNIRAFAIILVTFLLSNLLAGCSSHVTSLNSPALAPEQQQHELSLPPPLAIKAASSENGLCFRLGAEYDSELPHRNVGIQGDNVILDPLGPETAEGESGLAFAIYAIGMDSHSNDEDAFVYLNWVDVIKTPEKFWLGLANYEQDRWDWFVPEWYMFEMTNKLSVELRWGSSPYLSADKPLLLAVVAMGERSGRLQLVAAGGFLYPQLYLSPVRGYAGEERAVTQTPIGTAPMSFAWDFDAGAIPQTSNASSPYIKFTARGSYVGSFTVSSPYGPPVSDALQIKVVPAFSGGWVHTWRPDTSCYFEPDSCRCTGDSLGNMYLSGHCRMSTDMQRNGTAIIAKLGANEELQWAKRWYTEAQPPQFSRTSFTDIACDNSSSIYVAGLTVTFVKDDEASARQNQVVAKLGLDGSTEWVRSWSAGNGDTLDALAVEPEYGACLVGRYYGTDGWNLRAVNYSPSGQQLWSKGIKACTLSVWPDAAVMDSQGNVYILGFAPDQENASIVLKLDEHGDVAWARLILDGEKGWLGGIEVGQDNSVYVAGGGDIVPGYVDGTNAVVISFSENGSLQWCRRLQGFSGSHVMAMSADGNQLFMTGALEHYFQDAALLALCMTTAGEVPWAITWDNHPDHAKGSNLCLGADGDVFMVGTGGDNVGLWQDRDVNFDSEYIEVASCDCSTVDLATAQSEVVIESDDINLLFDQCHGALVLHYAPQ